MQAFTLQEAAELRKNPNVAKVMSNRVYYTKEFRKFAVEEMAKGKGPTTVFREAGFNTKLLGPKRIERAAARWRDRK